MLSFWIDSYRDRCVSPKRSQQNKQWCVSDRKEPLLWSELTEGNKFWAQADGLRWWLSSDTVLTEHCKLNVKYFRKWTLQKNSPKCWDCRKASHRHMYCVYKAGLVFTVYFLLKTYDCVILSGTNVSPKYQCKLVLLHWSLILQLLLQPRTIADTGAWTGNILIGLKHLHQGQLEGFGLLKTSHLSSKRLS